MDYKRWIPILKEQAIKEQDKAPKELHSSVHGMGHLERVWSRAEKLGKELDADMEALAAAVFLHDIGRHYGLELHGPESARHAEGALDKIGFPKGKRGVVLRAIGAHDYQADPKERDSLEARILYDADKLDAFGDVGIQRFTQKYLVEKRVKMTIPEILASIDRRWETLMLPETRELAKEDYDKIKNHFEAML